MTTDNVRKKLGFGVQLSELGYKCIELKSIKNIVHSTNVPKIVILGNMAEACLQYISCFSQEPNNIVSILM